MSDEESKTAETVEATPETTTAPQGISAVVHSDTLWDGPRWVQNLGHEPVWVETKQQYRDELNKRGLRMKDMQESTTGPEREIVPEIPIEFTPTKPPAPLTQREAHIFSAMRHFFLKHGIKEAIFCNQCFARKREHGCRASSSARMVFIECRCGVAKYVPPTGTTDMLMERLSNLTHTSDDKSTALISTDVGGVMVPALTLAKHEADLLREYAVLMRARDYEMSWYCVNCWDGLLDDDMGISITANAVSIVCPKHCRILHREDRAVSIH